MTKQLHKRFSTKEVKMLLKCKCQGLFPSISAVSYSEDPKHIKEAKVHEDRGDGIGPGEIWSRSQIVSSIESGYSFITILKTEDDKWKRGEDVHIIEVKGKKYIRTDKNEIEEDNLGELPEL